MVGFKRFSKIIDSRNVNLVTNLSIFPPKFAISFKVDLSAEVISVSLLSIFLTVLFLSETNNFCKVNNIFMTKLNS